MIINKESHEHAFYSLDFYNQIYGTPDTEMKWVTEDMWKTYHCLSSALVKRGNYAWWEKKANIFPLIYFL